MPRSQPARWRQTDLALVARRAIVLTDPQLAIAGMIPVPLPVANMRLNDAACDAAGRLWFGSMATDGQLGRASLFMLAADHSLTRARAPVSMYWRTRSVELSAVERLQLPRPAADDAEIARIDELLASEQQTVPLREALDELPADQQELIRKHVIEERDHAEIARELAVSTDVVRARLSRGLRRLAASNSLMDKGS